MTNAPCARPRISSITNPATRITAVASFFHASRCFYPARVTAFVWALALFAASTTFAGDLPDPKFTPGDADSSLTKEAICAPDISKSRRYVRAELKRKVYVLYGMTPDGDPCPCEVDHLIPLALGGTNRLRNLWPQSHSTKPWNSLAKDRLERRLHDNVYHGIIELRAAQHEIATDWIAAYKVRFGEP
jgi:hypothetical protein